MGKSTTKQIIIDYTHALTRIGVAVEGELTHLYLDTPINENVQNRIVVGQIEKVVKNLKGAFVNFGEEKNGLLHFKQVPECYQNKLQQGARIPVQIKKENTGDKGHKLTSLLNIQGYYLVCMVFEPQICISKKIRDAQKREELKGILERVSDGQYGFMVRTKAQDVSAEIVEQEARFLMEEADKLMKHKDYVTRGTVLLKEAPLYFQVIMDHMHQGESIEVISNSQTVVDDLRRRLSCLLEEDTVHYTVYPYNENLFKLFSHEKCFENSLKHKIWLKNGGNIVVDYTEAMTIIDVNSAKAVLSKNYQKAVMELNALAVKEAIIQIQQRNLAGMILIDLVDLKSQEDKKYIYDYAKTLIEKYDKERLTAYPITEIGLLQMTRTKKYNSVTDILKTNCTRCGQRGGNAHIIYKIYEIEEKLKHMSMHTVQEKVFVHCSTAINQMVEINDWKKTFEDTYKMEISWEVNKGVKEDFYEIKYHNI